MAASVTKLLNATIAGTDSVIELADANGVKYQLEADSTTGQLLIKRNGTAAAGFGAYGAAYVRVQAKTASYTCTAADSGSIFTTTGASGAIVFTLPAVATAGAGWNATFFNTVDQNMTVTAPADTLVAFNNAAADGIAFSTSSEKIGGGFRIVCDGTKYLCFVHLGTEAQTPTVVSA